MELPLVRDLRPQVLEQAREELLLVRQRPALALADFRPLGHEALPEALDVHGGRHRSQGIPQLGQADVAGAVLVADAEHLKGLQVRYAELRERSAPLLRVEALRHPQLRGVLAGPDSCRGSLTQSGGERGVLAQEPLAQVQEQHRGRYVRQRREELLHREHPVTIAVHDLEVVGSRRRVDAQNAGGLREGVLVHRVRIDAWVGVAMGLAHAAGVRHPHGARPSALHATHVEQVGEHLLHFLERMLERLVVLEQLLAEVH
mmetsp:Transcript_23338/g.59601  ORF Transcript_23338/g.59601 Transcript_23338/m.59601 type:complete len:259 (+) Transcript_23338:833-1609(+)